MNKKAGVDKRQEVYMKNEELNRLYEALQFYADEETHRVFIDTNGFITTRAIKDSGEMARKVLELLK